MHGCWGWGNAYSASAVSKAKASCSAAAESWISSSPLKEICTSASTPEKRPKDSLKRAGDL